MIKTPPQIVIDLFKNTPGAMSVCEMIAIHNIALSAPHQTPNSIGVTLGSHAGKDAIAAVSGLQNIGYDRFIMVDPCYDLKNVKAWEQTCQKTADSMPWSYVNDPDFNDLVKARVKLASGNNINPLLMGMASMDALPLISEDIGYIMIDSNDHDRPLLKAETDLLRNILKPGAILALHDFGTYVPVNEIYDELVTSRLYEPIRIPWTEIIEFAAANDLESGNNTWHCPAEPFPCHVGALRRI